MRAKTRNIIMVFAVVAVLLVGSVCAYFTDSESATNVFTVGNVDIELTEPAFDPDNGEDMYAGKVVAKDPTVTNAGVNDAYVYLKVSVPKANVVTAHENGKRISQDVTPLFAYEANAAWTLLETNTSNNEYDEYLYAYASVLASGEKTAPLFEEVAFVNLIEGQVPASTTLEVVVDAYAIQSDFATAKTAAEAWEIYCNQNN